jgi:hypothetical protein
MSRRAGHAGEDHVHASGIKGVLGNKATIIKRFQLISCSAQDLVALDGDQAAFIRTSSSLE